GGTEVLPLPGQEETPGAGSTAAAEPPPAPRAPVAETAVVGLPATATLDALFELRPLMSRVAARLGLAAPAGDGSAGADEVPEGTVPSYGRWLDVLAAASAFAALGLTGWCAARARQGPARRPAGGLPADWEDEDSSYSRSV